MGQVQEGMTQLKDTLARTVECDDCKDNYNHAPLACWSAADNGEAPEAAAICTEEAPLHVVADLLQALPPGLRLCIVGSSQLKKAATESLVRAVARKLSVALSGHLVVLTCGNPGVQAAFADGLGDFPSLVHLLPEGPPSVGGTGVVQYCGRTVQMRDAGFEQVGQVYLTFEGDQEAASIARAAVSRGAIVVPVICTGGASGGAHGFPISALTRPQWVTEPEWSCLQDATSSDVVAGAVLSIVTKAVHLEEYEKSLEQKSRQFGKSRTSLGHSTSNLTCQEDDHVRFQTKQLDPELAKHLESKEFVDRCTTMFNEADKDSSGYLEAGHEAHHIGEAVRRVLPNVFLDRFAGVQAQNYALSFDKDWDGKLSREEFIGFVRWATMMQARGLLVAQDCFDEVSSGTGERLMIVSKYMDEDTTLHSAVKSNLDLVSYSPSGITALEFAQQVMAANRKRQEAGLRAYQSVALANHGPDADGTWGPFAGAARTLTNPADVEHLIPAFHALASLLPAAGGGRLDLLACDLASVPGGMDFLKRIGEETGQRVCASKGATGNVAQGGDWHMEHGDVNIAADYFDEGRLQNFGRLMRNKIAPKGAMRATNKIGQKGIGLANAKDHSKDPHRKMNERVREHMDSSSGSE